MIIVTYVSVEPYHLGRYLDERNWRFNERECDDGERFRSVLASVSSKRLNYKEPTGMSRQERSSEHRRDKVEASGAGDDGAL